MKNSWVILLLFFFLPVSAQYFTFSTGTTYPYQQGCQESLDVVLDTSSSAYGAAAGLLRLRLNPNQYHYFTSDIATDLQANLFLPYMQTFASWTNPVGSPSWIAGSEYTILQMDRYNSLSLYKGRGLYGKISFVPSFAASSGDFGVVYDGDTIKTVLSYGGANIISPAQQNSRLTGHFLFVQEPCVGDSVFPVVSLSTPSQGLIKQSSSAGIHFSLTDNGGSSADVPYIWVGGEWTGNVDGRDPQQGINISTLQVSLVGNGQSRSFNGGTYATSQGKTWEDKDKNYTVDIPESAIFSYGIEKPISLSLSVKDRAGHLISQSIVFNQASAPTISQQSPAAGDQFVSLDAPVSFAVADEWAGVNTGTLIVTISAVQSGGAARGPFVYTGTLIDQHSLFPPSSTVKVRVQVQDMVGNPLDTSWTFQTRPSCQELGCCQDKYSVIKNQLFPIYTTSLTISGGVDPSFSFVPGEQTGYLNCGLVDQGLSIYMGSEGDSVNAQLVAVSDSSTLRIGTPNIKAILSGATLYLEKIFTYGVLSEVKGAVGGGGVHLVMDNCPDGDFSSSYYDLSCTDSTHAAAQDLSVLIKNSPYSQELNDAYLYAYSVGMTTVAPIQRANIPGRVLRVHLAKMLVEYVVKVLGKYPDVTNKDCLQFTDLADQSAEMQFYAKISCQLGLMGMESDGVRIKSTFDPLNEVTRGQFGTIFSRVLFGSANNLGTGELGMSYYTKHLDALHAVGIIKNIDPTLIETRGFVMLMLKRAYDAGLVDQERMITAAMNGAVALLDN